MTLTFPARLRRPGLALCLLLAGLGSARADAPAVPPNGYLLYEAASKGDFATVQGLVNDDPALAVLKFDAGITTLHAAALADEPRIVDLLVAHGALVDARGGPNPMTPLFLAAYKNNLHTVQALIAHHADPNTRSDLPGLDGAIGVRPLHLAAINGNPAMADFLVQHGSVLDAKSADGVTATEYSRRAARLPLYELLTEYAKLGLVKGRPIAALMVAIAQDDSVAVGKMVTRSPSLARLVFPDGETTLHVAASVGGGGACRALLAHGADVRAQETATGWTAAMRAYTAGHPELCNYLHDVEVRVAAESSKRR